MKAGRELDALIAEKVMEWARREITDHEKLLMRETKLRLQNEFSMECLDRLERESILEIAFGQKIPLYSTEIAAAWQVVEKMQANDWAFILDNMKHFLGNWDAHFECDERAVVSAESESAPHAICLAALKAVG